ncbi:MAG: UPF0182 family protein [Anaerolineae bacterium]
MSRDDFDIPEVFRRAMEEGGWRDKGDDDGGDRPPFPRRPKQPRRNNRSLWFFVAVVLLLLSVNWIVTTYTEWLWFTEINRQGVWFKQWGTRVASFVAFFLLALVILLGNWHIARRRAIHSTSPFNPQPLNLPGVQWLITGAAVLLAFGFGSSGASKWEEFLRYFYRVSYGKADPIFNHDISFYLFELPVYEFLQGWLVSLLFMTLMGVVVIYAANNLPDVQRGQWRPHRSAAVRQHIALVGAILLGLWAAGHWFSIYGLLYSRRGVVFGASYTDIHASLWAMRAQILFMTLTALAAAYNIFRPSLRPLFLAGGLWLASAILMGGLYPGLLQRYAVEPNEIVRESPYISYNIEFTRLGFALDKIETRPFENVTDLSQKDLDENSTILKNIRLWDYRPLRDTYEQLQALRPYYQFGEVDIDRYVIDGELRQVMLAARELDRDKLPAPSWVNRNLEFTHGYGVVMNPVNRVTPEGQPEFFIQDLPPKSNIPLEITRPEVYYSELTNDVVFVSSGREEFSYPSGNENVYSSYAGKGGVPLDSYLKRVAFAVRLSDANVLLSDEIDSGTRVQLHRQITDRVKQITPFLELDRDPYIVVWDGRLVWMMDAYTISNRFPYSTPTGKRFNYIRNSVKITVDAYDGTVTYYMADSNDPLIQSYARAFPGLFRPLSEMPEGLLSHIRYPEDLFLIQTQKYLTYHMLDVRVFYNKEDLWEIPFEIFEGGEQAIEPYYVTMSLPGEEKKTEYLLIQPYTPAGKNNMVAWVAARNDPPHYGELIVYKLPKQELVFGPIQVEGRIDQEPTISQQFSLWDQRGSSIIRGNLLVIPLNESFLYVEPVYLRAETSALPELKRVIVASDTRIAMGVTLEEALNKLLGSSPAAESTSTETTGPVNAAALDATIEELILSANAHFEAAEAAQRQGDWATYGQELDALQSDLARLAELTGVTP